MPPQTHEKGPYLAFAVALGKICQLTAAGLKSAKFELVKQIGFFGHPKGRGIMFWLFGCVGQVRLTPFVLSAPRLTNGTAR